MIDWLVTGLVYTTFRSRNHRLTAVTYDEWETIVKKLLQQYGKNNQI